MVGPCHVSIGFVHHEEVSLAVVVTGVDNDTTCTCRTMRWTMARRTSVRTVCHQGPGMPHDGRIKDTQIKPKVQPNPKKQPVHSPVVEQLVDSGMCEEAADAALMSCLEGLEEGDEEGKKECYRKASEVMLRCEPF